MIPYGCRKILSRGQTHFKNEIFPGFENWSEVFSALNCSGLRTLASSTVTPEDHVAVSKTGGVHSFPGR